MSGHPELLTLIAEIRKSREVLARITRYYEGHFAPLSPRPETTENAIVLAEVMNNYYTCAETIFLRFRHFHRYYLEFNYDWERLRIVESRFCSVREPVDDALDEFERYLLDVSKL